jgi:methylphosphotriester-DNA--protein-cysteine methyltransferase
MRVREPRKPYRLLGRAGRPYLSAEKGALGGNRSSQIYGRLDCPAALRAIARGGYVAHRVFFASAGDAEAAGYRPCGVCLPDAYQAWKRRDRKPGSTDS